MEYSLGYREVIPDQTISDKPREVILNTGGNQSTLQDIKVPERAGGYSYKNTSKYYTQNRFISWRTSRDILELVECSLDLNLVNNRVRYKFNDTPILGGISVHETSSSVIILVVTVSSVHKLSFPHPDKIHKQDSILNESLNIQSIFSDVSLQNIKNSHTFNVIPSTDLTNTPVAYAATSCLVESQTEALYALAYSTGSILLLHLDITTGLLQSNELKQESIVPRFLSGIATAFRGRMTSVDIPMCLVMHPYGDDVNLFALCREGRIRMWSCSKMQCVTVVDVLSNNYTLDQTIQNYDLKKFNDSDNSNELYLCTYLKFEAECEFCILKVTQESNTFKLVKVSTVMAINQHLVDFSFTTTRLWAVWRTTELDTVAVTTTLLPLQKNKQMNCKWESVVLEHPPDKDYIITDFGIDPQQAYIKYIFHPGRFSIIDITRALNIYQKSFSSSEVILSSSVLKEKVCMAVESEIQTEVLEYELTDEDYLEIVNRCWSKFYSCVLQYHINGTRPVGILLLPNVYGIILLKKSSFSILRPMEILEHLMLSNSQVYPEQLKNLVSIFSQENSIHQDVITLISALTTLEENLTDDFKTLFKKELSQLNSPDIIIEKLLNKFSCELHGLFTDFDFQSEIYRILENIQDISNAMAILLEFLTYDRQKHNESNINSKCNGNSSTFLDIHYFFGSKLGTSVISKTTTQINTLRFTMCRNLLILQQTALSRPELFNSLNLHVIKSSLAPKTVVLTQAYYVVTWICESNVIVSSAQSAVEISSQRLSVLKYTDYDLNLKNQRHRSHSLLDLFIQHGVKHYKQELIDSTIINLSSLNYWHFGMLKYATLVSQLIWPISGDFYFPDWLLFSCQFPLVQEYVRLLNPWCEWNGAARKFILAVSFLEMGEPQKAYDNFLKAFNGMLTDNYLVNLLMPDAVSDNIAPSHYFLKVIQIFEQHNLPDYIIELAVTAVTIAEKSDPNLPTLHSIVFARHLDLQHHIEAYNCLNVNPDTDRRIDCLRQLVVTLFDRKKLLDLVSFPYVDMYQDLEKIVEDRARSVDVITCSYYNFLYSFHLNKGNARKAASIMYEQAVRLNEEPPSTTIFSRQTCCLLACINALALVNEKHRWIVRPIVDIVKRDGDKKSGALLKPEEILNYRVNKNVKVFELSDIKKEYILAKAKFKLLKHNPDLFITVQTSPIEIVIIMSRVGLFKDALNVCESFGLSKASVLENLASECAKFSSKSSVNLQNWIYLNDIADTYTLNLSVTDISWKLLQDLLTEHEKEGQSTLHKEVTKKLLQLDMFVPQWLYTSYSKRNPTEFLRLLMMMGRLEEAAYFALDYYEALLNGKNKETFGLETILVATNPPVCSPFNFLSILIAQLKEASQENDFYTEIYAMVQDATDKYTKAVKRISNDMIAFKIK